jgi:calcineurin-like phosphoesterase family protein/quinohemoprotein amine dehydrogenase alpha subunit-like protein
MKPLAIRRRRLGVAGLAAAAALTALIQPAVSGAASTVRPAALVPAATGDPVIVAAGDIACAPPNPPVGPESKVCQQNATADLIDQIKPTAVLPVGDLQYNKGTIEEFMGSNGYNDTWGRFKSISKPVIGDNEYEVVHGLGYWDYWNGAGNNDGQAATRNKGWYSYDLGTWHVIALNSERGGNGETWIPQASWDEQLAWLQADLAAHPYQCTLAYWHKPLYSTGTSYSDPKPFGELAYAAGVDVVLTGHAHRYERFVPQDADSNASPTGFMHWTVGTGGKSINPVQAYNKNLAVAGEGHGVLKMTLHAGSYDWQFVNAPGTTIQDSGSGNCVGGGIIPSQTAPSVSTVSPNGAVVGNAGTTVEINGSGFTGSTVDFGPGVTVKSVTVASPSRIVATVDVAPGTAAGARDVVVTNAGGLSATCSKCFTIAATSGGIPTGETPGYWFTASDGGIFAFGNAGFYGSTGAIKLAQPIVSMSPTSTGKGYWLVASDGGIFAFGDAKFHGSTGNIRLVKPIVGMATTPTGNGYWLVASDGGIFAFGDAAFYGSTGAIKLAKPIIGMMPTPSGNGYWMIASDGGVFAYGDAKFHGSTGSLKLASPIVGVAATPTGGGYWFTGANGAIYAFGDAGFFGAAGDSRLAKPIVGMAATNSGKGYWLVASDGGIFAYGDAKFHGSTGNIKLNQPIVGLAPSL